MGFRLGQEVGGPLDDVPVRLLRFEDQQHHVHESRQPRRDADLADRRHVKNDVIEVAGFELRHEFHESLRQNPGKLVAARFLGDDIEIVLDLGAILR